MYSAFVEVLKRKQQLQQNQEAYVLKGNVGMPGEYKTIWLNTSRDIFVQNLLQPITATYLHQGPELLSEPNKEPPSWGTTLSFSQFAWLIFSHIQ